jgi:hypothetical protein
MSVNGFPGNRHEGYTTVAAAEEAWRHAVAVGETGPAPPLDVAQRSSYSSPLNDEDAYWVIVQGVAPGVYHGL